MAESSDADIYKYLTGFQSFRCAEFHDLEVLGSVCEETAVGMPWDT